MRKIFIGILLISVVLVVISSGCIIEKNNNHSKTNNNITKNQTQNNINHTITNATNNTTNNKEQNKTSDNTLKFSSIYSDIVITTHKNVSLKDKIKYVKVKPVSVRGIGNFFFIYVTGNDKKEFQICKEWFNSSFVETAILGIPVSINVTKKIVVTVDIPNTLQVKKLLYKTKDYEVTNDYIKINSDVIWSEIKVKNDFEHDVLDKIFPEKKIYVGDSKIVNLDGKYLIIKRSQSIIKNAIYFEVRINGFYPYSVTFNLTGLTNSESGKVFHFNTEYGEGTVTVINGQPLTNITNIIVKPFFIFVDDNPIHSFLWVELYGTKGKDIIIIRDENLLTNKHTEITTNIYNTTVKINFTGNMLYKIFLPGKVTIYEDNIIKKSNNSLEIPISTVTNRIMFENNDVKKLFENNIKVESLSKSMTSFPS